MFRFSRIHWAVVALCAGASPLAAAQQSQQLQKVEITGSRIKRVDAETPAPVQVITRAQIEQSGASSITEVLKSLPANNAGAFDENAVASFTPGAGGVSLRGLGAQATLVLINGRRVAPFGFASGGQTTFVDINSIPLDAVERIDVLLDGASALYGSDAMAGVINVILRKDFNGMQARVGLGQTAPYADATSKRAAVVWGKGSLASDGYNFFVNYEHIEQDPVKASARPRTATSDFRSIGGLDRRSSYAKPGNVYDLSSAGGAFLGTLPGCTPLADGSALNGRCIYQLTDHQDIIADTSRDSLFAAGTLELGGGTQLFGDLSLMRTRYKQESPAYSSGTYQAVGTIPTAGLLMPADHPQNTFGQDVQVRYRLDDVPQVADVVSDTSRLVLGARGTWAGWDAETGLLVSRSKTKYDQTGFVVDEVLANEVYGSSTFIYGNPGANDPALMARLYPTLKNLGTTSTTGVDLRGSREFGQLPGGPMGLALGVETRRESYKSTPDPLISADAFSVLGASSSDGSRNVSAVYAELSAPIVKSVETQLALRVDHYSDFGTATTPKLGLKWKALTNLALRATYAEGFRAPSLTELVQSPTRGFYSGLVDPQLCPVPDPDNANCDLSVEAIFGSNPNLKPEKSKSFTVGMVFEPTNNLTISADVFHIKRRDEIHGLSPDYLLANESRYPGYVERDPDTGEITRLNLLYSNLGSTETWGMDVDVKGKIPMAEMGTLSLELAYNRQPSYKVKPVADAEAEQWAGFYLQPKERITFGATWEKGPWTVKGIWNYIGAYQRRYTPSDVACPYEGTPAVGLCTIKAWSTTDLYVAYKGFKNLELGLSVKNLENKQAPIDQRMEGRFTLFDSAYHNQLGRFITLSAKYTFW